MKRLLMTPGWSGQSDQCDEGFIADKCDFGDDRLGGAILRSDECAGAIGVRRSDSQVDRIFLGKLDRS
ncbi:MAG UNVERIFIED_CONTAM: hypothetical protein LVR18_49685 [Planctomycetaceae bacterium]